ncbi:MAG TPA: aminoacyl-tRNA hydrolase [Candidatus Baltobacteraceae bacterium]|nr:aminoacyl-tRNA hydrolase [Candidatus Baltobacteraceae bacterium]
MIVGLGNPGPKYERTRHNVGFLVIDELSRRLSIDNWKKKDDARQAYDSARKIVLVQPQSFMNNSGVPVRLLASWYRTQPEDLLVIYDDMDLPFGKVRMRPFGGHGGHNGMRSIIATMTDRFPRIRIGVGRPTRSPEVSNGQGDTGIDHVLSPFTSDEQALVPKVIQAAAEAAELWLSDSIEAAMQFVNNLEVA